MSDANWSGWRWEWKAEPLISLAELRGILGVCRHCGDAVEVLECGICGGRHRHACIECHQELAHGVIRLPRTLRV